MTSRVDKIEDQTDTAAIAQRARELFARWTAEEEAGYEGEVSWEEFKNPSTRSVSLNAGCSASVRRWP